jgi:hypothetical protein
LRRNNDRKLPIGETVTDDTTQEARMRIFERLRSHAQSMTAVERRLFKTMVNGLRDDAASRDKPAPRRREETRCCSADKAAGNVQMLGTRS